MSQASDSVSLPGHPESFGRPPLHARVRDFIPLPHVTEQDDHSPKSAHALRLYIRSLLLYIGSRQVRITTRQR